MTILFDISRLHVKLALLFIINAVFFFLYMSIPKEELFDNPNNASLTDIIFSSILVGVHFSAGYGFKPKSLRSKLMYVSHAVLSFIIFLI